MRIVIIGAVAAGTSAAAKARRNSEEADIVLYEKDRFISYSGCGMPYYIGGKIEDPADLFPRDPAFFKTRYNVDVHIAHEVLSIHPSDRSIRVRNLLTGDEFADSYDKLVLATGAKPFIPPVKGIDKEHVFTLRNVSDMLRIKAYMEDAAPRTAVIVGSGFIGLEVCENLKVAGIDVTIVEKLPQVMPALDDDMSVYVKDHLVNNGITVMTGTQIDEIGSGHVILNDGRQVPADMVLISTGVRPDTDLAKSAGIALGVAGAIKVDAGMRTNIEDIYACGDCIEQFNVVTGKPVYRPMGSTANKTGRIAGDSVTGGTLEFRGILGTGIFKLFDRTVGHTGLSESEAIGLGYDVEVCHNTKPDRPEYMGGQDMVIKGIADRKSGRMLGVQIVGAEGVDKRIDVFVTAITFGAKAEDLFHLDLAYAPPFSTTKDPVMYTGMILDNAISKGRPLLTAENFRRLVDSGEKYDLIDTRTEAQFEKSHIPTAQSVPHARLRDLASGLDQDAIVVTYCNGGVTGNAAQNILLNKGFKKVYNLSGGIKHFKKFKD